MLESNTRVLQFVTAIIDHDYNWFGDIGQARQIAREYVVRVQRYTFRVAPLEDELRRIVFACATRAVELNVLDIRQGLDAEEGRLDSRTGRYGLIGIPCILDVSVRFSHLTHRDDVLAA